MKKTKHAKSIINALIFAVATQGIAMLYTGSEPEAEYLKVYKKNVSIDKGCNISVKFKASSKVKIKSKNKKVATARIKRKFIVITGKNSGRVKVRIRCKKLTRYINVLVTSKKQTASSSDAFKENTVTNSSGKMANAPDRIYGIPSDRPAPTDAKHTPVPGSKPTEFPEELRTPKPTNLPEELRTPKPTGFPEETLNPEPTGFPEETLSPEPTDFPQETHTPEATELINPK